MTRRVLVTGATTPLGEALIRRLAASDEVAEVLAVGLEPPEHGSAGVFEMIPGVTYRSVDLVRLRKLRCLLFGPVRDHGIDTVVHLAMHRRTSDSGEAAHRLHVDSTRELLSLARRHPTLKRVVIRSIAEVYEVSSHRPDLIGPDHPLNLSASAPQWIRDRVEADLTACTQMGMSPDLSIAVLRTAECLCPGVGSQLWDYLQSRVCLRPMGYDPMINVISIDDMARALFLATLSDAEGVFNIPGADTLPISELIRCFDRRDIPVPGPLLFPLYAARARVRGADFRYGANASRFHFNGVLSGPRALKVLGYEPEVSPAALV